MEGTRTLINKLLSRNEEQIIVQEIMFPMGWRFLLWSTVHSGKIYLHFRINPTPIFKVADTLNKREVLVLFY